MDTKDLLTKSRREIGDSALKYEAVDLSSVDYQPANPFKGLFCTVAGNVIVGGVDGVDSPALPITVGVWPLGGIKVERTGTTATVVALY